MIRQYLSRMQITLLLLPKKFWVLWIGTFFNRMGMLVLPFLTIYLTAKQHIAANAVGLIAALPGLGSIMAAFLVSIFADRFGRKQLLVLALIVAAVFLVPMPFITSLTLLAMTVLIWSSTNEMVGPLTQVLVTDVTPPDQHRQAISILRVAINLSVFGLALGGVIAAVSYVPLFMIDAGTNVIFAVLTFFLFSVVESPTTESRPHYHLAQALIPFQNRVFRRLWFATFIGLLIYSQMITTFAVYFTQQGGTTLFYGGLMTLSCLLIVFMEFPLATAVYHIPIERVMAIGSLLYAGATGLCFLINSPNWLVLPVLAFTFGEMFFEPAFGSLAADLAPFEQQGTYTGLLWVATGLGMTVGPALGGELLYISPLVCWGILPVIGLLGAMLAWTTTTRTCLPMDTELLKQSNEP